MRVTDYMRMGQTRLPHKVTPKIKNQVIKDFKKVGLDGNGRFRKPQYGLTKAMEVLNKYGIEQGETISADHFRGDKKNITVDLAFSNPEDPFSPQAITNSMLAFSYTKLRDNHYECLAYLS